MTLFSHDDDPEDKKIFMKKVSVLGPEFPVELPDNQISETTVEPSVIPEIQSILDEIDAELKEETAGQLKKIIKERLAKIKKLEAELQKEKAAFATLVQMNPTEFANLTGNQKLLSSGQWLFDAICSGKTDNEYEDIIRIKSNL